MTAQNEKQSPASRDPHVGESVTMERAARIVEGDVYKERYRTWPAIPGYEGNRSNDSELVRHCDALAAAIRALSSPALEGVAEGLANALRHLIAAHVDSGRPPTPAIAKAMEEASPALDAYLASRATPHVAEMRTGDPSNSGKRMTTTLRLDGTPCECGRPTGQCIKGDLEHCPAWEEEEADDDADLYDINCGMVPGQGCTLAGTEWCDWDCPHASSAPHNRRVRRKKPALLELMESPLSSQERRDG